MKSATNQKGVVIIIALFIVAIVAAMSLAMMSRLEKDTRRTTLLLRDTEASLYAQGSVTWAMDVLRTNWENKKPDKLVDVLPLVSPIDSVNGFTIKSTITDMQSRFNLNNLVKAEAQIDFTLLVRTVYPAISQQDANQIAKAITDWVTPATQITEFDRYYLEQPKPYRSAHRLMQNASELRLVKGVTPAIFNALQPYIVALPTQTLININTAPAIVLTSLSQALSLPQAQEIEQKRQAALFPTVQAFSELEVVKAAHLTEEKITTTSTYFLVETTISIEKQRTVFYTLLERLNDGNSAIIILWQSKGIW